MGNLSLMPKILALEEKMREFPQLDLPVKHYHIEGVYVRELFIPAGTVLTGKIHNKENISILSQGELMISNGDSALRIIKAPYTVVDKPGVKRLGYAITDCTFINVLRSDKKTVPELEEELVSDTFEQYEQKRLGVL